MKQTIILYSVYCFLLLAAFCEERIPGTFRWRISPATVLILGYFMYSSALPISIIFFNTIPPENTGRYLTAINLGALGYLIGVVVTRRVFPSLLFAPGPRRGRVYRRLNSQVSVLFASTFFALFLFRMFYLSNFNIGNLFTHYGFESQEGTTNVILETLGGPAAAAFLLIALITTQDDGTRGKYLIIGLLLIVCGFYILRGGRLWAMMCALPAVIILLRESTVRMRAFIMVIVIAFSLIQTVGFIRDYGFSKVNEINMTTEDFDPVDNEFGTSYKVYSLSETFGFFETLKLGASYTSEALLVCIPRFLWPDRPDGLAMQLAVMATGRYHRDELTMAYGYSNLSEAIVNFGFWGIVPIFTITYIMFARLSAVLIAHGPWGSCAYGMLGSMAVLHNRYDATMMLKVYFVLIFWAYVAVRLVMLFPGRPTFQAKAGILKSPVLTP